MAEKTTDDAGNAATLESIEKSLATLTEQLGSRDAAIKELGETNKGIRTFMENGAGGFSHFEAGKESVGYFDDAAYDDKSRRQTPTGNLKARYSIPKGYAPVKEWAPKNREDLSGFGEFIREGVIAHSKAYQGNERTQGKFFDKYQKCFEKCEPQTQFDAGIDTPDIRKAIQGMSEQVGSDGGFAVLPQYAPGILERLYENNLLSLTDGYTVTGNQMIFLANAETSRATGSRFGGLRGYYVPEGGTITASKPTLRRISLRLHKIAVVCYFTNEQLADSGQAIAGLVTKYAANEFAFMIGDAMFNGLGGGHPLGFMNSPALISIGAESGQLAATIRAENIDKMWARRLQVAGANYNWYAHPDTHPQLSAINQPGAVVGYPLNRPGGSIATAPSAMLKGRPVVDTEWNQTLGTAGDLALADFGQMLSITKGGIGQDVSPHIEFLTDQTAVRLTMRFDLRPWDVSAITPFKGSNTTSPFVVLATRS